MSIVVSDTSPIRALHQLGLISLLETLFGEVLVPPAVVAELAAPRRAFPSIDVASVACLRVTAPKDQSQVAILRRTLDAGESEAIALALELGADLIDEASGRSEARRLGIQPVGVLAVLIRGKKSGAVSAVMPLVDRLRDDFGFFVSTHLAGTIRQLCRGVIAPMTILTHLSLHLQYPCRRNGVRR